MIRRISYKALVTGVAVLLVASFAAGLHAQEKRGPFGRRGPGGRGFAGLAELGLTDAQREQVRDVMQRYREQMREAGTRLHDAHEAQRQAVEAVPVNEGLIRSTSQTLGAAQTDMALLQARIHNDVWSLLTPEQQEKAKQLKSQRETRRNQRLERRRPRG